MNKFKLCTALCSLVAATGCQLMVNPFADEMACRPPVTTSSAAQARAAQVTPSVRHRDFATMKLAERDGAVTHGPLYFEDPFVSRGSEDGRFAWTFEELLYIFYGPARFGINGGFLPVSAVVSPPWTVMASEVHDGPCAVHVVRNAGRSTSTPDGDG